MERSGGMLAHNLMHLFVETFFPIFLFNNKWVLDDSRSSEFEDDSETFHIEKNATLRVIEN